MRFLSVPVLLCLALVAASPSESLAQDKRHAGHHHEAPHGGTLVEIGDHFAFLELVHDADAGSLTLYVLDGHAEKALRVTHPALTLRLEQPGAAPVTLELKARARAITGETVGDTSEFVVTSDALKGRTSGRGILLEIVIKGQTIKDLAVAWPDDSKY